jgi:hypothetical protein
VSGDTENMHPAGADLYHEQHIQPAQEDRVNVEVDPEPGDPTLSGGKCGWRLSG